MKRQERLVRFLFALFVSQHAMGLVPEDDLNNSLGTNSSDNFGNVIAIKAKEFADSAFECGVYYQYTAGGLKNNPKVPVEMVNFVSNNSKSLLSTAELLYSSLGISTNQKYDELMEQARTLLRQDKNTGNNDFGTIYQYGEKCRLLLVNYPARLEELSDFLAGD